MWIELKIVIGYLKTLKMSTSIDREFLARATIALFALRPMLHHQQRFLHILQLLCFCAQVWYTGLVFFFARSLG